MRAKVSASAVVLLVAIAVACGEDPKSRFPTAPAVPTYTALTINGPDNVPPGQTAQYTAVITNADGLVKTATATTDIRWNTSNISRLRITNSGLATAMNSNGDITLTAEATVPRTGGAVKVRGSRELTVQPAGTFRLIGAITESDTGSGIASARVGILPSTSTIATDGTGRYRLFAVPPDATIRVTATGYDTQDQAVHLTANSTQDFRLNLSGPRVALTGPHTLTIDASSSCASSLPPELRQRSYDAFVTMTGSNFTVNLTEPRFRVDNGGLGNHFFGTAKGGVAQFEIRSFASYSYYGFFYFNYPDLAERLPDGTFLVIDGFTQATASGSGVTGTMSGGVARYGSSFPGNPNSTESCFANNHKFTLMPR